MGSLVTNLTALDYGIVVAYVIVLVFIGYRASFSKKKKTRRNTFPRQ